MPARSRSRRGGSARAPRREPSRSPSRRPEPRRRHAGWLALAALAPLLLYAPTLGHGFLLDDFVLYKTSPSLGDLASIPRGFASDVGAVRKGADTVISSYYRPVFLALGTLYHRVAGGEPTPWHLAAILLAGAVGALACAFLLRWGLAPPTALLASLVFSLHPSHVSSVAWVSGLQELLAALFSLAALVVLAGVVHANGEHASPQSSKPWRTVALVSAFYGLALLCKEVSVGVWLFVVVWAWRLGPAEEGVRRRLRMASGVLGAATVVYLAVRVAVLGGLARPLEGAPAIWSTVHAIPVAAATYLRLLLWPVEFSIFRPERPTLALLSVPVLVASATLLAGAALAWWGVRRRPGLLAPVAWFVVWLLPVLNVWALDPQWMVTDRYLFLPALALPWALALLLPPRPARIALAVLAVLFAGLTLRYARIFANERLFVTTMARVEPTSPLVFTELARLERAEGRRGAARANLERAVALDPLGPGAQIALGELKLESGELDAAERHFRQALVRRPYASAPFKRLALAWAARGRADRARALAVEVARRWPDDFEGQLLAALFAQAAGDRPAAETAFARAVALRPADPGVAGGLDATAARLLPRLLAPLPPAAPPIPAPGLSPSRGAPGGSR